MAVDISTSSAIFLFLLLIGVLYQKFFAREVDAKFTLEEQEIHDHYLETEGKLESLHTAPAGSRRFNRRTCFR